MKGKWEEMALAVFSCTLVLPLSCWHLLAGKGIDIKWAEIAHFHFCLNSSRDYSSRKLCLGFFEEGRRQSSVDEMVLIG